MRFLLPLSLAAAAALFVATADATVPKVTPLSVGIELEIGDVYIAEYSSTCAGCNYAPTAYQLPLMRSGGDSSIAGMPLWLVTVDGNKGHYPAANHGPGCQDAATSNKFGAGYQAFTWNGVMEIEGGPIDVNDEVLFRRQVSNMIDFIGIVEAKVKCTRKSTKWTSSGIQTTVTDDIQGEDMPQLTTTPNDKYERAFPMSQLASAFKKAFKDRSNLSVIKWNEARRQVWTANSFTATPYDHKPYVFCRSPTVKQEPLPAPQVNFVVPLAKWGYEFDETTDGVKDLRMFSVETETPSVVLKAAQEALVAAHATLFTGAHSWLWQVPEVRGLLTFGLFTAGMQGNIANTNRVMLRAAYQHARTNLGMLDQAAVQYAQGVVNSQADGGKNPFMVMPKTCSPDYARVLPPKVKAAFAAWVIAITKVTFKNEIYTEFNQRLTAANPKWDFKGTDKYNDCGNTCMTDVGNLIDSFWDDLRPGVSGRYSASETADVYGDIDSNSVAVTTRGPVVRTTPLRLKDTSHLMVLVEQRTGGINQFLHMALSPKFTTTVDQFFQEGIVAVIKKRQLPYLPPCPTADVNTHAGCTSDTVVVRGNNASKQQARTAIKSHTVGGRHICYAPEETLFNINHTARDGVKAGTWADFVGYCKAGNVATVMYMV